MSIRIILYIPSCSYIQYTYRSICHTYSYVYTCTMHMYYICVYVTSIRHFRVKLKINFAICALVTVYFHNENCRQPGLYIRNDVEIFKFRIKLQFNFPLHKKEKYSQYSSTHEKIISLKRIRFKTKPLSRVLFAGPIGDCKALSWLSKYARISPIIHPHPHQPPQLISITHPQPLPILKSHYHPCHLPSYRHHC